MSSSLAFPLSSTFIPSIFDPRPRESTQRSPESSPIDDQQNSKSRNLFDRRPKNQLSKSFQFEKQAGFGESSGEQTQKLTEILPLSRSKSAAIALYNRNSRLELAEKSSLFGIDIYV